MTNYQWDSAFAELFERCLGRYRSGDTEFEGYYTEEDLTLLGSIGYRKREFFDFVEDFAETGEPSLATAVMIASVRRDYFHEIMRGSTSDRVLDPSDLPSKSDELAGYVWLPRILAKARAKLRGELDPYSMYCCGGDRSFLRRHDIAPADFLRMIWSAGDDDSKAVEFVKRRGKK